MTRFIAHASDHHSAIICRLTLIGWFPRTTAALLLLSDNHLLVAKPTLATAASSWQMCSF